MGFIPIPKTVEHPLLAKGVILTQGDRTFVLCTLDWMEVHNDSYDFLRSEIAKAANTTSSCVALHCLHQHTGPAIDSTAQNIQFQTDTPRLTASLKYEQDVAKKLQAAIKKARLKLSSVTQIGTSKCKVDRVASNRRIKQPDGSIHVRSSSATDTKLQAAPEGSSIPGCAHSRSMITINRSSKFIITPHIRKVFTATPASAMTQSVSPASVSSRRTMCFSCTSQAVEETSRWVNTITDRVKPAKN